MKSVHPQHPLPLDPLLILYSTSTIIWTTKNAIKGDREREIPL